MKNNSASMVLAALASIVVLAHFVFAGDRPANANRSEEASLVPGTQCVVTAQLECKIHEVNEKAILVAVSAIREANQDSPVLKVPYVNRVFKNSGIQSTEMEVIVRISKDRIKTIRPVQAKEKLKQ